jgi:hypothetical protein
MKTLLKAVLISMTLGMFLINTDSVDAQTWRNTRREYRREIKRERKQMRHELREAIKDECTAIRPRLISIGMDDSIVDISRV